MGKKKPPTNRWTKEGWLSPRDTSSQTWHYDKYDITTGPEGQEVVMATLTSVRIAITKDDQGSDSVTLVLGKTSRSFFTLQPALMRLQFLDAAQQEIWTGTFKLSVKCTDKGAIDGRTWNIEKGLYDRVADANWQGSGGQWDRC